MRRYWRLPEEKAMEFERLLSETDYSAQKCARIAGVVIGGGNAGKIIRACRRYVANGRWVDQKTGQLRPAQVCTSACAMEKTGLSVRTIKRRTNEGIVRPKPLPSHKGVFAFSEKDIERLIKIGRKRSRAGSSLTPADIRTIRRLARTRVHREIAEVYGVSRRQISRIVSGERWADIPLNEPQRKAS